MVNKKINNLLEAEQYSIGALDKKNLFINLLKEIFSHHYNNSIEVKNILNSLQYDDEKIMELSDFPFFPVRIFKELELKSISKENILKTLTSSGTTGQKVSKIFLDAFTAKIQTKALASIISSYIGKKRIPMLIIDSDSVLKNRKMFSARGAGILGLSNFGRNHLYILDENMRLKKDALNEFLSEYSNQPVLLFGFTFMVWIHFIQELSKINIHFNIPEGILIHSGGWKKLESLAVNNEVFKETIKEWTGIEKVYNFYGMVEQVGSIYMECEEGFFHTSNFSEIIIRDPLTFKPLEIKNRGIIQTISLLPFSYPGNSILTEDEGIIFGRDDCKCGRRGTYFKVLGRIAKAELRGCSDTYTDSLGGN